MYLEKLTNDDYKKLVKIILPTAIDFDVENQFGDYVLNIAETSKVLNFSISDYEITPLNKTAKVWVEKFPIDEHFFNFMHEKFGKKYELQFSNFNDCYSK